MTSAPAPAHPATIAAAPDMGYLDRRGRLFIVGREDDMIVFGGENVYPRAVENALAELPQVAHNAVIGVPDEDYGQRLAAVVVPRQNADIEEASIREFLKDKVSRFEQPRDINIVDKIPRAQPCAQRASMSAMSSSTGIGRPAVASAAALSPAGQADR